MVDRTELGRITRATWGFGGYQDAQFGLTLVFGSKSWGCNAFIGAWAIERPDLCQWSEADRAASIFDAAWKLKETLEKSKKLHVGELVGIPVECTFDGNALQSWRVLEEVL